MAVPVIKHISMIGKKLMLERYVLLEVTHHLRLLPPQRMKWLLKSFNTPPRARHTVMCVTVQRHREEVPSTHHCGSIMVLKRTIHLGDLKVLRVFRIATIPLCQNFRGRQLSLLTRHHGNTLVPNKAIHLGEHNRSRKRVRFHFTHPKQYGAFPRRIVLPYSYSEILSGYEEEDVSSTQDGFTAWVKSDPETVLNRHVVDSNGIYLAHREAPARKHSPSSSGYHFNLTRLIVQLNKRGLAFTIGISVLEVQKHEILKVILR